MVSSLDRPLAILANSRPLKARGRRSNRVGYRDFAGAIMSAAAHDASTKSLVSARKENMTRDFHPALLLRRAKIIMHHLVATISGFPLTGLALHMIAVLLDLAAIAKR
jgi:hypothetical protein